MNKNSFSILLLIFVSKTNCMELISPTIQDRVITPAIVLGIGAAGGATQAVLLNYVNKKNNIDHQCNIAESATKGLIHTLPLVLADQCFSLDNRKVILAAIGCEVFRNGALPIAYYFLSVRPLVNWANFTWETRVFADDDDKTEDDHLVLLRLNKSAKKESKCARWLGDKCIYSGLALGATLAFFLDKFLDKK